MTPDRRTFLKTVAAATASIGIDAVAQTPAAPSAVRFGVDMYSLGAQNWTPFQQLDFAAKWNVKVVHFSEIRFLGNLEPDNLKKVRACADELGLDLEIGMRSICPTSAMFDKAAGHRRGTARTHGRRRDASSARRSSGPCSAAAPIAKAASSGTSTRWSTCSRASRSRVMDAGVKVAIENHAGDMQARELKTLIEAAGPDFVGVCLDSGNPVWTIEDPHLTLETLAPYVLTSHMRDSALWKTPDGIAVRWTRMGEGNMGMEEYLRTYIQKCPGKAVSLEVIVSGQPRMFNYAKPEVLGRSIATSRPGSSRDSWPLRQGQTDPRAACRIRR